MSIPKKQTVLGIGISTTSYDEVTAVCRDWIERRRSARGETRGRYICVTSVHGIMTAVFDPSFRRELNSADMATPDGMPVVWALRSFGCRGQRRVYGPDLMLALCHQAAELGHRIFLYGSRPQTLEHLERRLLRRFPKLVIGGSYSPPFRALTCAEDREITTRIIAADADLIFIGLSTPRQERWMAAHRARIPGVMVGVGAAFDFHAGQLKQAPPWMQQHGLEWLFRLLMEPRRLWKRYLLITPLFLPMWSLQKLRILRYEAARQFDAESA